MRRRRHRLQVSTFPFMAVLLCAMGSLILLLLIMDRQGKKAALIAAIAKKTHRERPSANEPPDETTSREIERLNEELCRLEAIRWALQQERLDVQEQLLRGRQSLAEIRNRTESLQRRYARSGEKRDRRRRQRDRLRAVAVGLDEDLADLASRLQQARMRLAARKKREIIKKTVFSLVPYRGPRGESRKPIYGECRNGGIVLLPPRVELIGPGFTAEAIRREMQKRIANYGDSGGKRPYLLLLVRPDGIRSFYAVRQAISGLPVDLGYELIDADWSIEVNLADGKSTVLAGRPVALEPGDSNRPDTGVGFGRSPFGAARGPVAHPGSLRLPGKTGAASRPGARPGIRPPTQSATSGSASTARNGKSAGSDSQTQRQRTSPERNKSDVKPPPPISHDWFIAVECSADGVHVPLLRRRYALRELQIPLGGGSDHPLTRALAAMIDHRRRIAQAQGRNYRPIIRFEVPPDGLRSYHLAYPLLETLNVPMVRKNLSPAPLP